MAKERSVNRREGGEGKHCISFPDFIQRQKQTIVAAERALPIASPDQQALFPQLGLSLTPDGGMWQELRFGMPYEGCCLLPLRPRTTSWSQGSPAINIHFHFLRKWGKKSRKLSTGFSEFKHMTLTSKEKQTFPNRSE